MTDDPRERRHDRPEPAKPARRPTLAARRRPARAPTASGRRTRAPTKRRSRLPRAPTHCGAVPTAPDPRRRTRHRPPASRPATPEPDAGAATPVADADAGPTRRDGRRGPARALHRATAARRAYPMTIRNPTGAGARRRARGPQEARHRGCDHCSCCSRCSASRSSIQLRGNSADSDLAAMREDDLVRLLSDLHAQEERLQREISDPGGQPAPARSPAPRAATAALAEASKRADELGILAGTAAGPGARADHPVRRRARSRSRRPTCSTRCRSCAARTRRRCRSPARTARGADRRAHLLHRRRAAGSMVAGKRLTGPYTITVIGDPPTMRTALNIPGRAGAVDQSATAVT